jgi:hypothetical protein
MNQEMTVMMENPPFNLKIGMNRTKLIMREELSIKS